MRGKMTVFDMVVHVHNMLNDNFETRAGRLTQPVIYRNSKMLKRTIEPVPPQDAFYANPPDVRLVHEKIFGAGSEIDYAMAQVVPLFDVFAEDPDQYVDRVHALVRLDPERMIFCGGTDPVLRGMGQSLRDVDHQITDLGARSMKFYTAHPEANSWRMDDRAVAYPLFERMLELGCNLAQVHKGDPQGVEPLDALHPRDVHQAALDFPDLNFVIHHFAFPFEDAAIDLAARLPNVYLSLSTFVNFIRIAPMFVADRWGKAMLWCGPEKLLFGSETPIWPRAQTLVDEVASFQLPQALQRGWGYPEITEADRRLILGENMLRLMDMAPLEAPATPQSGSDPVGA